MKRLGLGLMASLPLMVAGVAVAEEKILHIYNWNDYVAEDTIEKFESETGIETVYDVYDSNDTLEAKLMAGRSGYDIVVPTSDFLRRQVAAGIHSELDRSLLPNWVNLDEEIMAFATSHDPGNKHGVVYMWGTVGIGYDVNLVNERISADEIGWDMIFKPEVAAKLADCGIAYLDSPDTVIPLMLNYLGQDPNSEDLDDLAVAEKALLLIRPSIRYFHSSQSINDLANADICVALGFSGDMLQARDRAAEAGSGAEIEYLIPPGGSAIWFDMLAIPTDAPHPKNAHAFINFILKPEIAADISNYVYYANANKNSLPLIDSEVKDDPGIYPPTAVKSESFVINPRTPRYDRKLRRTWTRIKTGL